jgi:hypothetical protein
MNSRTGQQEAGLEVVEEICDLWLTDAPVKECASRWHKVTVIVSGQPLVVRLMSDWLYSLPGPVTGAQSALRCTMATIDPEPTVPTSRNSTQPATRS